MSGFGLDQLLDRQEQLLHSDDRLVVHIAELHSPDSESGRVPICTGCDHLDRPMNAPPWPCRTWHLLDQEVDR